MLARYTKLLSDAPHGQSFRTRFGDFRNLGELRNALVEHGKSFYDLYVNSSENHFANWVSGVFNDQGLAAELANAKTYTETTKILDTTIKFSDLWLSMNSKKENLNLFLAGMSDSLLQNSPRFEPEHQKFETLNNFNVTSVVSNPPKATILPEITPFADVYSDKVDEVFANEPANTETNESKAGMQSNEGTNLSRTEPPNAKGFFGRLFSAFGY